MLSKVWSYRNELIYWTMFTSCLILDWATSYRVSLLPHQVAYLGDLLLIVALVIIIYIRVSKGIKLPKSNLYAPFIFLFILAITSAVLNQQNLINLLWGLRIYFKFLIWFAFLLIVPLKFDLPRVFSWSMVWWAFAQIPIAISQSYIFNYDRDLRSGTILGSQRLSLLLVFVFYYFFSYQVLHGKNKWMPLIGLFILIPTSLGESKAMFVFFPIAFILLLWLMREWVSGKFIAISISIMLIANIISLGLYPQNARNEIISIVKDPISIVYHQSRFSSYIKSIEGGDDKYIPVKSISPEDFENIEKLEENSEGRPLGRFAAIRFAVKNGRELSRGGLLLGAGVGSTADSSINAANGTIFNAYPTFRLNKTPITMVLLELGILGLLGFAWLVFELFRIAYKLSVSTDKSKIPIGIMGIGLCVTLIFAFIYTNIFVSEAFMFVTVTFMAGMIMASSEFEPDIIS